VNYGLYLSASGVLSNSYRQDVFANNLANVNTVGFKPDLPTLSQRPAEAVEDLTPLGTSHDLLDRLGGGVLAAPQRINFSTAPIEQTGRPLDVALEDPDQFFAVQTLDPEAGQFAVRLTRDGRLGVNGDGFLVNASGHRVLDAGDQPIAVTPGVEVTLAADGRVMQNGTAVAEIQVATVNDTSALEKAGGNLFAFVGNDPRSFGGTPSIRVAALESSGTNAISTMMSVMRSAKSASGNARLIQYHDSLMDAAVNKLGRVA
jgi:flagellar basal body rod protein FlgG